MDQTIDLLQIKIEKAKNELSKETLNAISKVDWRTAVLSMKEKKGFSLDQLEHLEIETELLLCGLISPDEYPEKLEEELRIPKAQIDVLVNDMNELVFKKIRQELINATEKEEILNENNLKNKAENKTEVKEEHITTETREELLSKIENPKPTPSTVPTRIEIPKEDIKNKEEPIVPIIPKIPSISAQKFSNPFQTKTTSTEYKAEIPEKKIENPKILPTKNIDPYRMPLE